jgi:hypothetical protein
MPAPSWGDVAQIVTAVVAFLAWMSSRRNARNIDRVHKATNGMAHRLEEAARIVGQASGEAKGRRDEQEDERARRDGP